MDNVRAHVIIEGKVQGVFFRSYTQNEARKMHVTGWVKNRFDGKVEGVFEGEKNAVDALIDWCRTGPPHASVKKVEIQWEDYQEEFFSFSITF
jgi:acylphosphatase